MPTLPKVLFQIKEVQFMLSCGKTHIYDLIKEGHLVLHSRGRITAKSIITYADKLKVELKKPLA